MKKLLPLLIGLLWHAQAWACALPCTAAPSLVNQQTFSPGNHNYGGSNFTVHGDGVTDDTAALQAAINAGDVFINGGSTYLVGSTTFITMPSNRNIRCADHSAVLKFVPPSGPTSPQGLFLTNSGDTYFNCRMTGPYSTMHNQVPSPGYDGCNGSCPSGGTQSSASPWTASYFIVGFAQSNNTIVGNDFDGISGFSGAVELDTSGAGTTCNNGWKICGNTFESAGLEGVEIACGFNNTINYNVFNNAGSALEAEPANQTQLNTMVQHNTWDHNVFYWTFGTGQNNNGYCGLEGNRLGLIFHNCAGCTSTGVTSFNTNVMSNNTFITPTNSVGGVTGCTNKPCSLDCGLLLQNPFGLGTATTTNNNVGGVCGTCNQ